MATRSLRDADELLLPCVNAAIAALELQDRDQAIAALARRYASVIDDCANPEWGMRWIAPLLHEALESLGATPVARSKVKEGKQFSGTGQLAALRSARRA